MKIAKTSVVKLTSEEIQEVMRLKLEREQIMGEVMKETANLDINEIPRFFQSEDGISLFERVKPLLKKEYEIKEAALYREIEQVKEKPDDLLERAITYLTDSIDCFTLNKSFRGFPRDDLTKTVNFEKDLYTIAEPYLEALKAYPEHKKKFETFIEEQIKAYPKAFTVYSDMYIEYCDGLSFKWNQPPYRERFRDRFFKKTTYGEIYIRPDFEISDEERLINPFEYEEQLINPILSENSGMMVLFQENVFLREIASPNTALANDSFTEPLGKEITRTTTSKKKKKGKKTFSTTSIINWEPRDWQVIDKDNVPHRLLIQDRAIHDIIDSIKQEKDKKGEACYISPAEIYRNLTGSTDPHSRVSDIMIEKIDDAMNRLFASRLAADLTEEFEERGIKGKPIFTQHLILTDGEIVIKYPNGGTAKKYEIVKPPILGEWSRRTGQITHIPPKMLAYAEKRRTYENIGIVYYIARRIIQIANGQSNVILFDTIIESTIEDSQIVTAKKRTAIVKYVEGYLDYLKAEGFISSYKLVNEGRTWRSVEITPAPLKITENKDT